MAGGRQCGIDHHADPTGDARELTPMTRLEVCSNISAALRKRLDSGATEVSYYDHFAGFTR